MAHPFYRLVIETHDNVAGAKITAGGRAVWTDARYQCAMGFVKTKAAGDIRSDCLYFDAEPCPGNLAVITQLADNVFYQAGRNRKADSNTATVR